MAKICCPFSAQLCKPGKKAHGKTMLRTAKLMFLLVKSVAILIEVPGCGFDCKNNNGEDAPGWF